MKVYVSLTSIPTRVSRILEANLRSLIHQDYAVERIVVTVPTVNFRGQCCEAIDVSFLDRYPNVVCHRPDYDWGPIMKYVGGLEHIPEADALVFVCDDDQFYAVDRISNLVNHWRSLNDSKAIVGWIGDGVQSWARTVHTVHGVRGALVPRAALVDLHEVLKRTHVPRCCAVNDDALASIHFIKAGYHIVDRSGQDDEFAGEENLEEADGLHSAYAHPALKVLDIVCCHLRFNQPFAGLVLGTTVLAVLVLLASLVLSPRLYIR
jgi:hypothetical protein